MRTLSTLSLLALTMLSMSGHAFEIVNEETVLETASDVVPIPRSTPTTIVFKNCVQCASITLRIDATTRFFAQQTQVGLPEIRQLCGDRLVGVLVGYEPRTRVVTRFVTSCEPNARQRN